LRVTSSSGKPHDHHRGRVSPQPARDLQDRGRRAFERHELRLARVGEGDLDFFGDLSFGETDLFGDFFGELDLPLGDLSFGEGDLDFLGDLDGDLLDLFGDLDLERLLLYG